MVEDDLAKEIINRLLRNNNLLSSKLVHVLPCGGYTNVIDLAKEVVSSNLVGKHSKLSILLDGDVKSEAQKYVAKHGISNNIPINYLPVESLEKFLKSKLHDHVDHSLFRLLNDFIFHQVSLTEIIESYCAEVDINKDRSGKYPKGVKIKPLLESFCQRHEPIREYFFTGIGVFLQRTDATFTEHVLSHFVRTGTLVLPVHDSFMVASSHEQELLSVMEDTYRRETGFLPVISGGRSTWLNS